MDWRKIFGLLVTLAALVFLVALLASCWPPKPPRPPQGGAIWSETSRRPDVVPEAAGKILRERAVEVNVAKIGGPRNQALELPLFEDTVLQAVGVRTEAAGQGYVWIGQLRGEPLSQVILSVQGKLVAGNIQTERGGNYELRPAGNGVHLIRQLDPRSFKEDDINTGPAAEVLARPLPTVEPCGGTDGGQTIDVLIAYTAAARINNGGTAGIEALIYAAVARTNQSYLDSGVTQRMHVVHLREEAYTESGNSCTDLTRMRNASDGQLDALPTARDAHGADLVMLIVSGALVSTSQFSAAGARIGCAGAPAGVFGEVFNILNPNTTAFEPNALLVAQASAAGPNLTLAHEAGHLMGARHDRASDPTNNSPFAFNHGFFNNAAGCLQRSIMATGFSCPTCTRIPFWSNPGTTRCGAAFGIAAPAANSANNAAALNASAATVANFRCSSPGRTGVWMRDTWEDTGAEPDPRTAAQVMWQSPYIWIRRAQDATRVHQHEHETPPLGTPVFAYVKLHNGAGAAASGTLELYWAHSSTGLAWPGTWTLAGTATVTGMAASSTQIVEIAWTTPASAPSTAGHFCLLARWVSAADPIAGEGSDINANVRSSNNLVWRNLEQLPPGADGADAVFVARNLEPKRQAPMSVRIAPPREEANGSFLFYGQVVLTLDEAMFEAWQKGGRQGTGFQVLQGNQLLVTDPDGAQLDNLLLRDEGQVKLELRRTAETPPRKFHLEATQLMPRRDGTPAVVGGVTYELEAPRALQRPR